MAGPQQSGSQSAVGAGTHVSTSPTNQPVYDIVGQGLPPLGSGVLGVTADQKSYGILGAEMLPPLPIDAVNLSTQVGGGNSECGVYGCGGAVSGQKLPPVAGVIGDSNDGHGVYGASNSGGTWRPSSSPQSTIQYSGVIGVNTNTGYGVSGVAELGYGVYAFSYLGNAIYAQSGTDGLAAVHVEGDLEITGDVMLLGNGQDCAEQFDTAVGAEIEPGTVVSCDGEDDLRESREEYDKKVAGVVSGAGSCRPVILLGKRPSSKVPIHVGLVGKIYCKVDAQYGPIRVGDLLTTSATPGHAMKAADAVRAFGAVIGKALRNHDAGLGLIPILIALQ
jgi:hypothetical protein